MSGAVEQLHYTWARRGVEGVNRFQITAMSAGFKSGAARAALPTVRKVCRYDRPKRQDGTPVSFGWFDYRQQRIAFCRVGRPAVRGTVGNFAAHVLVGSPDDLPEAELASSFEAPFWWTGQPEDALELPVLRLPDALTAAGPASTDEDLTAACALTHALVTLPADARLLVTGDNVAFGRALRAVGRGLPEALAGLSLSTYEGAPTYPFQVVGGPAARGRRRECHLQSESGVDNLARETLKRLLASDPRSASLRTVARGASLLNGTPRRATVWQRARTVVGIASGALTYQKADVHLLRDARAVVYIATEEQGRQALAAGLQAHAPGLLDGLRAAHPMLPPDIAEALASTVASQYHSTGVLAGCARAAATLPPAAASALLDAVLDLAMSDVDAATTLDADDTIAVLARLREHDVPSSTCLSLLHVTSVHLARCATDRRVADVHVATMLRHVLETDDDQDSLLAATQARPGLLASAQLTGAEKTRCMAILESFDPQRLAAALPIFMPELADADRAARLATLVLQVPTATAAASVLATLRCLSEVPEPVSELCDDLAASLLHTAERAAPAHAGTVRLRALDLLEGSRSDDHPKSAELLRGLLGHRARPPLTSAAAASGLHHPGLRRTIRSLALARAVQEAGHVADARAIWHALRDSHPTATESETLRSLLEIVADHDQRTASATVIGWVARDLLPDHPRLLTTRGHLRDVEAERLARQIVSQLPDWLVDHASRYIDAGERRGRAWWRGLVAHRRKDRSGAA